MRGQAAEQSDSIAPKAAMPQIDPVPRVSIQAFCETPEIAAIVQAAIADRRMGKTHVKQNMGGAAAAVEAYRSAPTPNVIVLEATANREALVEQLDELSHFCDAGTKVMVVGTSPSAKVAEPAAGEPGTGSVRISCGVPAAVPTRRGVNMKPQTGSTVGW